MGYNLLEGPVNDVGFSGVVGADSILHGWPLYSADTNHTDTYGPVNYLAYVPASIVFPMAPGWARDGLAAAHATSIAVDLITLAMFVVLGRRLREGRRGHPPRGGARVPLRRLPVDVPRPGPGHQRRPDHTAACCAR